ncbi:hypothetical protein [Helicobacter trogontum]|uniref:Uncharacterized protein n=2 Tax=Helicobacter trogontum TaxID=50960 RepID=A0A4U8SAB2_9HELI|nr:hypothetical protein [Helicobacter trogontum]TLD82998.1 hypothetical protein LS81_006415 [Helicobacter trogontum]
MNKNCRSYEILLHMMLSCSKYKKSLIASFVIILCVYVDCYAKGIAPTIELNFDLKKDEVVYATISASKDSQSVMGVPKNFTLRWTLYRNEGLVILMRYDHYPYQFILYKDYRLNSFTLNLLDPQGVNRSPNQPQLRITFVGIDDPFNDEKTIAHLRITGFGDMDFTQQ